MALAHLRACQPIIITTNLLSPSSAPCAPLCPPGTVLCHGSILSCSPAGTHPVPFARSMPLTSAQLSLTPLERFTPSHFKSSTFLLNVVTVLKLYGNYFCACLLLGCKLCSSHFIDRAPWTTLVTSKSSTEVWGMNVLFLKTPCNLKSKVLWI